MTNDMEDLLSDALNEFGIETLYHSANGDVTITIIPPREVNRYVNIDEFEMAEGQEVVVCRYADLPAYDKKDRLTLKGNKRSIDKIKTGRYEIIGYIILE